MDFLNLKFTLLVNNLNFFYRNAWLLGLGILVTMRPTNWKEHVQWIVWGGTKAAQTEKRELMCGFGPFFLWDFFIGNFFSVANCRGSSRSIFHFLQSKDAIQRKSSD